MGELVMKKGFPYFFISDKADCIRKVVPLVTDFMSDYCSIWILILTHIVAYPESSNAPTPWSAY